MLEGEGSQLCLMSVACAHSRKAYGAWVLKVRNSARFEKRKTLPLDAVPQPEAKDLQTRHVMPHALPWAGFQATSHTFDGAKYAHTTALGISIASGYGDGASADTEVPVQRGMSSE